MRYARVVHRGDRPCLCGASVAAVDNPALALLDEGIRCTTGPISFPLRLQLAAANKARCLTATNTEVLETTEALLPVHRERLYPPTTTLSIFMRQTLEADASCQRAVNLFSSVAQAQSAKNVDLARV